MLLMIISRLKNLDTAKVLKAFRGIAVTMILFGVYNFLSSDIDGGFTLGGKDKDGNWSILSGRVAKMQPPMKHNNLITLRVDTLEMKEVSYQRRAFSVFGASAYLGGGVGVDGKGNLHGSLLMTLSF